MGRTKETEVEAVVELMYPDGIATFYFRKALLEITKQGRAVSSELSRIVVFIEDGSFDKEKIAKNWRNDIDSVFSKTNRKVELEVNWCDAGKTDWENNTKDERTEEDSVPTLTSPDDKTSFTVAILMMLARSNEVTSPYWASKGLGYQLERMISRDPVETKENTAIYFASNRRVSLTLPFQIKAHECLNLNFKRISATLFHVKISDKTKAGFLRACEEADVPFLPAIRNVDWVERIGKNPFSQVAYWSKYEDDGDQQVLRLRSLMYVDNEDDESARVTLVSLGRDPKLDTELVRDWLRMKELERDGNIKVPSKYTIVGLNCEEEDLSNLVMDFDESAELTFEDHVTSSTYGCIPVPIILQGSSLSNLDAMKESMKLYLHEKDMTDLGDFAYTTSKLFGERNEVPAYRFGVVASDLENLHIRLNDAGSHFANTKLIAPSPVLAFVFSGLGAGHIRMGKELFDTFPAFAQHLTQFHHYLLAKYEIPLLNIMFHDTIMPESNLLTDPVISQVVLYTFGLSLTWLWGSWGVLPDVVLGHSLGETLACVVSGMLSPTQGLDLIVLRGKLLKEHGAEGALLAVRAPVQQLQSLLDKFLEDSKMAGRSLEIVGFNSPIQTVVGGTNEEVGCFSEFCKLRNTTCKRLEVSRSYHSKTLRSSVANLGMEYEKYDKTYISTEISPGNPKFVSSLRLPNRLPSQVDLSHWQSVVSVEVDWIGAVKEVENEEPDLRVFLEISPKPILVSLTEECANKGRDYAFIPSIAKIDSPVESILEAAVALWVEGVGIDLQKVLESYARKLTILTDLPLSTVGGEENGKEIGTEGSVHSPRDLDSILRIVEMSFCEALGLEKGEVEQDALIGSLGINSVMALRIKNAIEARLELRQRLPATLLFDSPSINSTAKSIKSMLDVRAHSNMSELPKNSKICGVVEAPGRKIAILSQALRLPKGVTSPESYWDALCEPTDLSSKIPLSRFNYKDYYSEDGRGTGKLHTKFGCFLDHSDFEDFDSEFFGLSGREVEKLDPQQRMLLECTWEGLERAGIKPSSILESKTGIFIGLCHTDFSEVLEAYGTGASSDCLYVATGNYPSTASGRLSFLLKSRGPSLTVDTACSSSLSAFHLACQSLLSGESDIAIVGGVNLILSPHTYLRYSDGRMLSQDGHCYTWDERANGYVRGEGCGVVVLRRLNEAIAAGNPVNAVVRGTVMNSDGVAASLTAPNTHSQQELIKDTLAKSGLEPDDIGYLEIHGTGTKLGDAQEYTTLRSVFGDSRNSKRNFPLIVGSSKTCLGHLEPASGILALIKTTLCLQKKQVPVHQNFQNLNSHIDDTSFFVLNTKPEPMEWTSDPGSTRIAGINNFGFSGTNVHVILEEWVEGKEEKEARQSHCKLIPADALVTLSSKSLASLSSVVESWKHYLENELSSPEELFSAALTSGFGRDHYKYRAVARLSQGKILDFHVGSGTRLPIVFVLGADENDLSFEFLRFLYSQFKHFQVIVNQVEQEAQKSISLDLSFVRSILDPTFTPKKFEKCLHFCSQIAIGRFLIEAGLLPDAFILDSKFQENEYATVCKVLSGSVDLRTGLALLQRLSVPEGKPSEIPIIYLKDLQVDNQSPLFENDKPVLVLSIGSVGTVGSKICSSITDFFQNYSENLKHETKDVGSLWNIFGKAYINGRNLDFTVIYGEKFGKNQFVFDSKAPTYKFNRLTYPVPKFPKPASFTEVASPPPKESSDIVSSISHIGPLYTIQWIEAERLMTTQTELKDGWLIIDTNNSVGSLGKKITDAMGGQVVRVDMNEDSIPRSIDTQIKNSSNIVLVLDTFEPVDSTTTDLQNYQKKLFEVLLESLQLITVNGQVSSFTVLTQGMVQGSNPFVSTLHGTLGVYRREYPEVRIQQIDFDPIDMKERDDDLRVLDLIRDELLSDSCRDYGIHYSPTLKRSVQRLLPLNSEDLGVLPAKERIFDHEKIYIVTGGLGGIGSALTEWILENGGGQVWILSRNPPKDFEANPLSRFGARLKFWKCNVGNYDEVRLVFESLSRSSFGETPGESLSLGGIFHAAGTFRPKLFQECVWADFERVFETKVYGAWNLHLCSVEFESSLDYFVLFSSIASVFQIQGLAAYAGGNSFLNSLAEYRSGLGLASQSLVLSHVDAGIGKTLDRKKNGPGFAQLIETMGIEELLKIFPQALANSHISKMMVGNFNWGEYSKGPRIRFDPLFQSILEKATPVSPNGSNNFITKSVDQIPHTLKDIQEFLRKTLVDVGKFHENSLSGCDPTVGFGDMGLDSLMLMEFRDLIDDKFGEIVPISSTITFNYPTIDTLSTYIYNLVLKSMRKVEPRKSETLMSNPRTLEVQDPVSIIGMSCRFGGADSVHEYWELLAKGQSGIEPTPPSRYLIEDYFDPDPRTVGKMYCSAGGYIQNVESFDSTFFGITPREAAVLDPQHRLALEEMWHALESAGIPPNSLYETKTGIFLGISGSDYGDLLSPHAESALSSNPNFLTGTYTAAASGRLAHFLGTFGPAISVDTACSSSLVALNLGIQSLKSGETDLVLVGGVNLTLSPKMSLVICKAGMLSPDNTCWTFDERANGYVRGEGIGWVVLKRLGEAEKDGNQVLGIVRGIACNSDGASSTLTTPNGVSQSNLIQDALTASCLKPCDIDYIEAHGSATRIGDAIELQTLNQLASSRSSTDPLWIGCAKVNVGHTEVASGMAGLIKILLQLKHEVIPPHRNFNTLNPLIDPSPNMKIPLVPTTWSKTSRADAKRRAGISCFGFSGTNVFAIIEEYVPSKAQARSEITLRPTDIYTLSAKSQHSLEKQIINTQSILASTSCEREVRCISYTLNVGRSHLSPYRLAMTYSSKKELLQKLNAQNFEIMANSEAAFSLTLVFSTTLESVSSVDHYKELYFVYPFFRIRVDEILSLISKLTGLKLEPAFEMNDSDFIEFRKFALEFAWVETLLFILGADVPYKVVVNSGALGHILAALFSKSIQLEDAIKIFYQFLKFPSKFLSYVSKLEFSKPTCHLLSGISGTVETITSTRYWEEAFLTPSIGTHMHSSVFELATDATKTLVLEFGPVSQSHVKEKWGLSTLFHCFEASDPNDKSEDALWVSLSDLISKLYVRGWSTINWSGYYDMSKLEISDSAPLYPFEKVRHHYEQDPSFSGRREVESVKANATLEQSEVTSVITKSALPKLFDLTPDDIRSIVISSVSQITGYSESSLDPTLGFAEMGLNSQMALEVRELLVTALSERGHDEGEDSNGSEAFELPAVLLLDYPNIELLSSHLCSLVVGGDMIDSVPPSHPPLETKDISDIGLSLSHVSGVKGAPSGGNDIAVVAMSCNFPGSPSLEDFWSVLCSKTDVSAPVPKSRFDPTPYLDQGKMYTANACWLSEVDLFDPEFFGISTKEAICLDPQQRLLLECVYSALESGSISPDSLRGSRTGVYVGITNNDYAQLVRKNSSIYNATGNSFSTASGRISYILGLHGPSLSIDTACSSSLVSTHYGVLDLLAGKTDLAIVGGVNLCLLPGPFVELCNGQMLSRDGHCKTWDTGANGYVRGEGAGVVVLKRLSDCRPGSDAVIGIIKSSVVNQDGPSSSLTTPNGLAQVELMTKGLAEAELSPEDVSYLEIHGTGTTLGDSQEAGAVSVVYSPYHPPQAPLLIGTAKTTIGHLESAAGVAGLIKILLSIQKRTIPPHKNLTTLNPTITHVEHFHLPPTSQPWNPPNGKPLRAGINSFGFSGTNAHMILEEPGREFIISEHTLSQLEGLLPSHLLTLSAKTQKGLVSLIETWSKYLESHVSPSSFPHVCYTSSVGRSQFRYRLALTSKNLEDCSTQLSNILADKSTICLNASSRTINRTPKIVFLFTGQGAVYSGMCRELYYSQKRFRTALDECEDWLQKRIPVSLTSLLWDPKFEPLLKSNEYSQLATFVIEYSLASMWDSLGVRPNAVIGHSIGEYAGAVVAGVMDCKTALEIVLSRGNFMTSLGSDGGMIAVGTSESGVQNLLQSFDSTGMNGGLEFAGFNSPKQTVLAGSFERIEAFKTFCNEQRIRTKILDVSKPFHSSGMVEASEAFEEFCHGFEFNRTDPAVEFFSSSVGAKVKKFCSSYWSSQIVNPVRFVTALKNAVRSFKPDETVIFLEVGPHGVLAPNVPLCLSELSKKGTTLISVKRDERNWTSLLKVVQSLWSLGISLDFDKLYEGLSSEGRVVRQFNLPPSPWDRRRIWIDDPAVEEVQVARIGVPSTPIHGKRTAESEEGPNKGLATFQIPVQQLFSERSYLSDHMVYDSVLFPGVGFILLMIEVGKANCGKGVLSLQEISLESPLIYNPEEASSNLLFTTIDLRSKCLEISSSETSFIHARGQWAEEGPIRSKEPVSLDQIQSRCSRTVESSDFYKFCHQNAFNYGSDFQVIKKLWLGENEGLTRISLPSQLCKNHEGNQTYHPVMVDGAFQTVILIQLQQALASSNGNLDEAIQLESDPYLPFGIDSFTLFKDPVPSTLFAYLRWEVSEAKGSQDVLVGDVALLEPENGSVIGSIVGFQAKRVSRTKLEASLRKSKASGETEMAKEELDEKSLLYTEEWVKDIGLEFKELDIEWLRDTYIPSFMSETEIVKELKDEHLVFPWLEDLSLKYLAQVVESLFIPKGLLNSTSIQDFIGSVFPRLSPHLKILIEYMLGVLLKNGALCLEGNKFSFDSSNLMSQFNAEWEARTVETIRESYPSYVSTLDLIWRCGTELSNVLLGSTDPLDLLFPAEGSEYEHISAGEQYNTCPQMAMSNSAIRSLLETVISSSSGSKDGDGILRILEIGAGTGGSTRHVLKTLASFPKLKYSYTYTDISKFFFGPAAEFCEELKGPGGSVVFRTLNIETDPKAQGYECHTYDLILATNVLHATKDISTTLANTRSLLVPNGLLICCEGTRPFLGLDVTFGLVDGWWRFWGQDPLRTNNPLMAPEIWDQALKSNGFDDVLLVDLHQSVFLSRASSSNPLPLNIQRNAPWLLIEPTNENLGLESLVQLLKCSTPSIERVPSDGLTSREAYSQLLNSFDEISGIIYCKSLERNEKDRTPQALTEFSQSKVQDFLHFCQAISEGVSAGSLNILEKVFVLVSGVLSVGPKDTTPVFPFSSTIWGMTKTLGRELGGNSVQVIGVDADSLSSTLSKLYSELWNRKTPTGGHFALRNGVKYVPKLVTLGERIQGPSLQLPTPSSDSSNNRFQLALPTSGTITIDSLQIVPMDNVEPPPLAPREIEVEVYFAGINFKDLLVAMDSFTEPNYYSFGGDFSGRVLRLGSEAANSYSVGDEVVGIAQDPYGTTAMTHLDWVSMKPTGISFAEATAIAAVGVTSYLSLVTVGKIKAGQTVLVHSAAGGVGLSAIRLCHLLGVRVIATVSSEAKREILRGMGVTDIYNSRDLSWINEVEHEVDLVLNTLTGPGCIASSLKLLKSNGTFIEISKRNIWTKEEMAKARPDVNYHIVALEKIIYHDTPYYKRLLDEACHLYEPKKDTEYKPLQPIAVKSYPLTQATSAFKFMLSGKHIGKLALCPIAKDKGPWGVVLEGTYIIAGAFGGLGLAVANWLLNQSQDVVIVLFGRSLPSTRPDWMVNNPRVHCILGSISKFPDCERMIKEVKSNDAFPPIKGVIHSAGTLADCLYPSQSWDKYESVFMPKVYGAWYLHLLTRSEPLVHFVVFSSAASYFGTAGQSSHVAASSFLDSLINYRRKNGYVGNSLLWGPWSEIGAAAGFKTSNLGPGMDFIDPRTGISVLNTLVTENAQETLVVNFDWSRFVPANTSTISPFWFQDIQSLISSEDDDENDGKDAGVDIFQPLDPEGLEMSQVEEHVRKVVLGHTSRATRTPISNIDPNEGFANLGVDSLMALDLRNNLQNIVPKDLCKLSSTAIFDYPTVNDLSKYIVRLLDKAFGITKEGEQTEKDLANVTAVVRNDEEGGSTRESGSVAVIGMSCRFPGAPSISDYWELLLKGKVTTSTVPSERFKFNENEVVPNGKCYTSIGNFVSLIDEFDHTFFNLSPKEAKLMDPQHRLLLQGTWEALEDAGIPPDDIRNTRTAVFVGISGNDYWEVLGNERGPYIATGNSNSCAAGRISYHFDLIGPSMSIDTACSSSLVAFHMAAKSLESGEADLAIVGGANLILTPSLYINFCECNMLSKVGISRPFDEGSDGFVRGEGIGVVVLRKVFSDGTSPVRRISLPRTPPLAFVRSSVVNSDGYSSGYTVPNGQSQERLILEALDKGGLLPEQVSYLEAHGTSTPLGDPIEMNALAHVFGQERDVENSGPLYVSSVKANVGHLEAASGLAGLIKVVLSIQKKTVPPHPTFNSLNPLISAHGFFEIPTEPCKWSRESLVAGISSFGFSGTNAHVLLEGPTTSVEDQKSDGSYQLLTISAPSEPSLRTMIGNFIDYFESGIVSEETFADVAYTTNARRNHFKGARLGVVAKDKSQCLEKLRSALEGSTNSMSVPTKGNKVIFLIGNLSVSKFSSSWGKELFESCEQFAKIIRSISSFVKSLKVQLDEGVESLEELLFGGPKRFGLTRREEGSQDLLNRNLRQFSLSYSLSKFWESEFGVIPQGVVGIGVGELAAAAFTNMINLKDALRLVCTLSTTPMEKEELSSELEKVKDSHPKYTFFSGDGGNKVQKLKDLRFLFVESKGKLGSGLENGLEKVMNSSKGTTFVMFSPSEPSLWISKQYNVVSTVNTGEDEWYTALSALSNLYESGVSISWKSFDGNGCLRQNVGSVPRYQFEPVKHWFSSTEKGPTGSIRPEGTQMIELGKLNPYLGHLVFSSARCLYYENSEFRIRDALDLPSLIESVLIGIIPAVMESTTRGTSIRLYDVALKLKKGPESDFAVKWQTSVEKTSSSIITVDCNYQMRERADAFTWYPGFSCKIEQASNGVESLESYISQGFQEIDTRTVRNGKWGIITLLSEILKSISNPKIIRNIDEIMLKSFPGRTELSDGDSNDYVRFEKESEGSIEVVVVSTPENQPVIHIRGLEFIEENETASKVLDQESELFGKLRESSEKILKRMEEENTSNGPSVNTYADLDEIAILYITRAFENLGVLSQIDSKAKTGKRIHVSEILDEFQLIPKHEYLVQHIFRSLASRGYLIGNQVEGYTRNSDSLSFPILTEIEGNLSELVTEVERNGSEVPLLHLLCQCASKLDQILTGSQDPIKLLFPINNPALVSAADVYKESSDLLKAYNTISALFSSLSRRNRGCAYRILEVGGGTGGTTRHIYETLKSESIEFEYVFTDVSPYFFREAKAEFGQDERFSFTKFDVEVNPASEGLPLKAFDIVVASNVLHATRNMENTLGNIRALLKPSTGILVLCESNTRTLGSDLTFGLLEGWWAFGSGREKCPYRVDYPLLDGPGWDKALLDTGFSETIIIPGNQGVYLAKSGSDGGEMRWAFDMLKPTKSLQESPHGNGVNRNDASSSGSLLDALNDEGSSEANDVLAIENSLKSLLSDITGIPISNLKNKDVFTDLGMDSLMTIDLQGRLEMFLASSRFESTLSPKAAFDHPSIPTLTAHLISLKKSMN